MSDAHERVNAGTTTAFGASRPLRRIPAIVSFLNSQPALSLGGGNRPSCPEGDVWSGPRIYRIKWVSGHSVERRVFSTRGAGQLP